MAQIVTSLNGGDTVRGSKRRSAAQLKRLRKIICQRRGGMHQPAPPAASQNGSLYGRTRAACKTFMMTAPGRRGPIRARCVNAVQASPDTALALTNFGSSSEH